MMDVDRLDIQTFSRSLPFCLFVFLSFCLFVFLSFCLFVYPTCTFGYFSVTCSCNLPSFNQPSTWLSAMSSVTCSSKIFNFFTNLFYFFSNFTRTPSASKSARLDKISCLSSRCRNDKANTSLRSIVFTNLVPMH